MAKIKSAALGDIPFLLVGSKAITIQVVLIIQGTAEEGDSISIERCRNQLIGNNGKQTSSFLSYSQEVHSQRLAAAQAKVKIL